MPTLRSRIEARLARARRLGVRGLLTIESDTLLRIVKTTVAGTLAWAAADLMNSPRPALATLAAVLVVQVTVRATFARSIQLTVGVAAGLAIALGIGHLLGLHWWTIGLVVLAGLVTGEIIRLGPFSSQVAISALLAVSLGGNYGWIRTIDTVVGAVIGVAVNLLVPPPSQVRASAKTLRDIGEDLGALLADVGAGLADQLDRAAINRWLDRSRDVSGALRQAYDTLAAARESLVFNHRGRAETDRMDRLVEARRALDHATSQTRGIIRTLLDAAQTPTVLAAGAGIIRPFGPVLETAAASVAAYARLIADPASRPDREDARAAAARAPGELAALSARIAGLDTADPTHAGVARIASSMLVDLERLGHEVDVDAGTHAAAVATSAVVRPA